MNADEALAIAEKWVAEHKGPEYRVDPKGVHQTNHGWDVGFDIPDENGVVRASSKWARHGVEVHILGTCTELAEGSAKRPWKPVYDPEFVRIEGMTSDPGFPAVIGWVPAEGGEQHPNPAHVPRKGERPTTPIERLLDYVESGWLAADLIGHNAAHCEVLIPGEASLKAFDYPDTLTVYTSEELLPEGTALWHRISFNTFVARILATSDFKGTKPSSLHINPGLRYDTKFRCWDFADDAAQHLRMCGCGQYGTFKAERSPWVSQSDIAALDRIVNSGRTDAVAVRTVKVEFTLGVDDQGRKFVVREQPKHEPRFDPGKLRGCLIGGAIGDALGANTENLPMEVVYERHGPLGVTDLPEEAHITDDTQMTLFTFEAMIRAHVSGRVNGNPNTRSSFSTPASGGCTRRRRRGPRRAAHCPLRTNRTAGSSRTGTCSGCGRRGSRARARCRSSPGPVCAARSRSRSTTPRAAAASCGSPRSPGSRTTPSTRSPSPRSPPPRHTGIRVATSRRACSRC